ncbi:hypothetical protein BGX28_008479 [Mortierella sp. GBA30]|nr:hypothetical protein BGX28_008479 [Mortierella sp. GBA30]
MTDSHIQQTGNHFQHNTFTEVKVQEHHVAEGATITLKPALEPEDEEEEPALETEEVFFVTSTPGSDPTLVSTAEAPAAPASTVTEAKPSRLSLVFRGLSNGCGLCFHPLKNSGPANYHNLVVTPTEEEAPIIGQDYDHSDIAGGSGPLYIADDFKGEQHNAEGASSPVDYQHQESASQITESKATKIVTSTVTEEITVLDGSAIEDDAEAEDEGITIVLHRNIPEATVAAAAVAEIVTVSEVVEQKPVIVIATPARVVLDAPSASPSASPTTTRSKSFAKLRRRSSVSSPSVPSSPLSPSPLIERLGRFAKMIRSNDSTTTTATTTTTTTNSNSSIQTKVIESLEVSQVPEKLVTTVVSSPSTPRTTVSVPASVPEKKTQEKSGDNFVQTTIEKEDGQFSSVPAVPRQGHRRSLILDTAALKSQPVAIPGQAYEISTPMSAPLISNMAQRHTWTHSQTPTLHQASASSSSGQSLTLLTRTGRASTMDSGKTMEGNGSETGSVASGGKDDSSNKIKEDSKDKNKDKDNDKDGKKTRRKSVLKKLGKMINGDRKKEKAEKRLSQQGSLTMESPIEAEETFGF